MATVANPARGRAYPAVVLAIVCLALGWFGHKAIGGAPDVATISLYQGWRLACPPMSQGDGSCALQQNILDAKTRAQLAQLSIFDANDGTQLVVTVPFNVLLGPGLGLGLGNDKPLVYHYEACGDAGCSARIKFDDTLRAALSSATQARVLVIALNGKAVGLPFSVKGYNEALAAFDSVEARRHSWWRRLWS